MMQGSGTITFMTGAVVDKAEMIAMFTGNNLKLSNHDHRQWKGDPSLSHLTN